MKVLVVDDSATMRRIVINSLQRIGYPTCVEAPDAAEALRRLDDTVGCILTDWSLPDMDGIDFVRAVRSRADGRNVKIIMITTRTVREDIIAAARAGVNSYVVKPFTPEVLKEQMDRVLTSNGAAA